MSKLLFQIEAVEARIASYSCPRGTASRVHALRLRRRFQSPCKSQSGLLGNIRSWSTIHTAVSRDILVGVLPETHRQLFLEDEEHLPTTRFPSGPGTEPLRSPTAAKTFNRTSKDTKKGSVSQKAFGHQGIDRRIPPHMAEAYGGVTTDRAFIDQLGLQNQVKDTLNNAVEGGNPHAILAALIELTTTADGEYGEYGALVSMSPNTFSEILRCLDPKSFVGRYVDLHKRMGRERPPYFALQSHRHPKFHHFCSEFIDQIKKIIDGRLSRGLVLSITDYKYLLRCAKAVGNSRASHNVWLAMERVGLQPDTECYNHHLSAKVWPVTLSSSQRYHVRVLPRKLRGPKGEGGLRIKHEITKMFDQMVQDGAIGDEETFCLLLVALARQGDIDGVKAILARVWDINVDSLIVKDDNDLGTPKVFAVDSPIRPSKTLLFSLAHAFGINNAIPVALRLVDYVSRQYSIGIPTEVWEELLGWVSVLSKRHMSKDPEDDTNVGRLPPEAMSNLWAALIAKPYRVKPTMVMYDKLIINLIRRQRFGEVQRRIAEAHLLHLKCAERYSKSLTLMKTRSSSYNGEEVFQHQRRVDYENLLDLQRDKDIRFLCLNRSHQYLRRWCSLFVSQSTLSMRENAIFVAVNIPKFLYKFMDFMPLIVKYSTATGTVQFSSGSRQAR